MEWIKQGILVKTEDLKADWIGSHVQMPTPYYLNKDVIRIYFSTRDKECMSHPIYVDVDSHNFNLISRHTEPLLDLGKVGTFDDCGITFSSCVEFNDKLYMYYIGWNKTYNIPYKNAIGLAISEDGGEHFYKYSEGPIIDRNLDNPFFVATPFVYREQNKLKLLYLSCTKWEWNERDGYVPFYLIKSASSNDGVRWTEEGVAIEYKNDHEAIARPWLIEKEGKYYIWYSYRDTKDFRRNKDNAYMLGFAVSENGRDWNRRDELVGIEKSQLGWDAEMMCYPSVIQNGDEMVMFYNGNEHGKYALGYATCKMDSFYTDWRGFFHV